MIIKYNKDVNIKSLREDIQTLGEKFRILLNNGLEIEFFDIRKIVTNDEEIYQKRHKKINIDGENEVDVWENYNFDINSLNLIVNNHDKIKSEQKIDLLNKIKETDSKLIRGTEDIYDWAETIGFNPAQAQKDLIMERKAIRNQLNNI